MAVQVHSQYVCLRNVHSEGPKEEHFVELAVSGRIILELCKMRLGMDM
jgi:hypothetical protein